MVLDTIGGECHLLKVLKVYSGASYVTKITPKAMFLSNFPPVLSNIALHTHSSTTSRLLPIEFGVGKPVVCLTLVEIKPVNDAVYDLDQIVAAHHLVEE